MRSGVIHNIASRDQVRWQRLSLGRLPSSSETVRWVQICLGHKTNELAVQSPSPLDLFDDRYWHGAIMEVSGKIDRYIMQRGS